MTTLLPLLGTFGTTNIAQQILQSTYNPPAHIDPYIRKLLKELAMPPHIKNIASIDI